MTGYDSKRQMAADKVQEPVANSFEEYCKTLPPLWNTHISRTYAEQFFRAGQAAQPAQEPAATLWQHGETGRTRITMPSDITDCDARWFKVADLYITPPKRPWVGLTDEEILKMAYPIRWQEIDDFEADKAVNFAQTVEAKLKEKNNG